MLPEERLQKAILALDNQRVNGQWLLTAIETGMPVPVSGHKLPVMPATLLPRWITEAANVVGDRTVGERGRFMRDDIEVDFSDPASVVRSRLHQLEAIINALRAQGSERLVRGA